MGINIRAASTLGGAASVPNATTTTAGKVRLATSAETVTGTNSTAAVTPAGLASALSGVVGGLTYIEPWSAITATPDLSTAKKGYFYLVSGAGERYGIDWQVGDHLVINEDMGGTIDPNKIDKIDNTESIANLGDLLDVTLASEASGQVLRYSGTEWVNAQLDASDVSGVASDSDLTALEARVTTNEGDISTIDGRVTTNEGDISNLQTEVNAIEAGAGLSSAGTYSPDLTADYISTASSLKNADSLLDDQIKINADAISGSATNISNLQTEVNAIEAGAGLSSTGAYSPDLTADYISTASSLKNADSLLDDQIKINADAIAALGASSVESVNGVAPVAGDVTLGGADIDSAHSATNYTAASAALDDHLAGVDTALGLKADSSSLATVATSGAYADLSGTPTLATVATSGAYADLSGTPSLGTASALDVGTAIGDVVQLEDVGGSPALPAVDGSQLTGVVSDISGASVGDLSDVTITSAADGDALVYNGTAWVDQALATVATSGAYADLSGTPTLATVATSGAYADLSGTPTLGTAAALDVGTAANNVVQLNGSGELPAVDGSNLTGVVSDISGASVGDLSDVTITSAANGDALVYNGTAWVDQALATVATSGAYADLSGTPTLATVATSGAYADLSGTPTLASVATSGEYADLLNKPTLGTAAALDVGTAANNVVQLNGSGALPAVDGSNLTGITADVTTASLGDLSDVTITSAANGDALVYNGTAWVDQALATVATSGAYADLSGTPTLAAVATSGSYGDLLDAPQSMIGTAEFITTAADLTLEAGKHYIIGTAISTTKTLTLPAVTDAGEYIRITNWGDGELVIQVDQTDTDAYLLVGNTVVQGGSVTVESRATIDCFGFNYSAGGLDPAWGVYFSSSIELNTRSFSTTGQLPVYDATAGELAAGDLGDLTFSFSPTNYDNTRGGTVTGNAVGDHFGGVDDELGVLDGNITTLDGNITTLDSIAVKSINTLTPTAGAVTLGGADIDTSHTASDYTAASAALDDHLAGIDTRLAEKANKADGLNGLADVDLTTPATDGQILLFDGVSSTFKPGPPPAPVADETTLGLVELATDAEAQAATANDRAIVPSNLAALDLDTFADVVYPSAPTDDQVLQWVNANSRWEPKTFVPAAPSVTSDAPGATYTISTHDGIEEIYLLTPSVDCTVTIPSASTAGSGYKYFIKNLSTNVLTINATIDGTLGFDLNNENSALTIVSDGTNWFII